MTLKPVPTSHRFKVTSSIVITLNHEYNSMCRMKKHFLFHWNTLMLLGLLTLIWTSCKNRRLTITGMSIQASICQTPGEDSQRFKRLPDHTMYGQNYGRKLVKPLRIEKKWAKEKPILDNARKLKGISFVDPDDKEYQETLKNARRKLERLVAPAMPCKRMDKQHRSITKVMQNNGTEKEFKTMCGGMVEPHESTRQRPESLQSEIHEDRCACKGFTSMTHHNLVHKFISSHRQWRFWVQKLPWTRNGKSSSQFQHGTLDKSRIKKEVILEAQRVHVASLMDICHLRNAELEPKLQKYKGTFVHSGDNVKDDSGAYAVFPEQGSSASQITASKIMYVIALPVVMEKQADAVSAYTQVKLEDAPNLLKFRNPNVQMFRYVYHDANGLNHGRTLKIPWYFFNEICTVIHKPDC